MEMEGPDVNFGEATPKKSTHYDEGIVDIRTDGIVMTRLMI